MQRIRVDFPDPDGPHRTILSPARTVMSILFKAWKSSYHLSTLSITIIGVIALGTGAASWFIKVSVQSPRSVGDERNTIHALGELRYRLLHPLRIRLRQFAVGDDFVDEGIDRRVDFLLAKPRAGSVVNALEFKLVLEGVGLGGVQFVL